MKSSIRFASFTVQTAHTPPCEFPNEQSPRSRKGHRHSPVWTRGGGVSRLGGMALRNLLSAKMSLLESSLEAQVMCRATRYEQLKAAKDRAVSS